MASPFAYLPHRAVLSLSGPDTITLLERLVTNATDNWDSGETRYGALLTPQGKVIADYLALRTADGVLLDVSKEYVHDLAKRLKLFRLRSQVDIEIQEDMLVIAGLRAAAEYLKPAYGSLQIYLDARYPQGRLRVFASSQDWSLLNKEFPPEGPDPLREYHSDRIRHGIAEQGVDFGTAEVFPSDINMDILGGVALNKGCFVGQEVVSRMHRRGKIRKRTLPISLPERLDTDTGADILAPLPIGTVTSIEPPCALGMIRVDRLLKAETEDVSPSIGGTPVTIEKPDWLRSELETTEA